MRIIFWGTPIYSVNTLKTLINSDYEVKAVVTQPDKKRSRGNKLNPSPIKEIALQHNIPVFTPPKIKNNIEFISSLKAIECDIYVVIAYGKILSKEILDIPKFGSWNAHASLLPRWRGAAPIQWSILKGDEYTGVGIMKMEEGLDTGDILFEEKIKIDTDDNLYSLSNKLSLISSELFIKTIDLINNDPEKIKDKLWNQNIKKEEPKYARMINKNDYLLNFDDTADNIARKVNGLYPKVNIKYKNRNLKILKIKILHRNELQIYNENITGRIIDILKNEGVVISTKTYPIVILKIKLEGKTTSSNNQLIQQLNPKIGDILC